MINNIIYIYIFFCKVWAKAVTPFPLNSHVIKEALAPHSQGSVLATWVALLMAELQMQSQLSRRAEWVSRCLKTEREKWLHISHSQWRIGEALKRECFSPTLLEKIKYNLGITISFPVPHGKTEWYFCFPHMYSEEGIKQLEHRIPEEQVLMFKVN